MAKRITRTFTLTEEELALVDDEAARTHRSRSHMMSLIVSDYFKDRMVEKETAGVREE